MTDDEFFDGLEAMLRDTARGADVRRFAGAPIEQVDLVAELRKVAGVLADHCRMVLISGRGTWLEVADMLDAAAKSCRNEAVIDAAPPNSGER